MVEPVQHDLEADVAVRPETINVLRLPSGAVRVWLEGHSTVSITANSDTEAVGLLVKHYPDSLGIRLKEVPHENRTANPAAPAHHH